MSGPEPVALRDEADRYDRDAVVGRLGTSTRSVRYRSLGQGPPLILVPGLASTPRAYAAVLNRLAGSFRTVQLEYPGEDPDDGARLERIGHDDLAADLIGLADHLALDRPALFGLSFGSTVALRAMAMAPGRFGRSAMQGGFARRRLGPAERLGLAIGRRFRGRAADLPFHRVGLARGNKITFRGPGMVDRWAFYVEQNGRTPLPGLAHRLALMDRLDLRPILPAIPGPILLVHGLDDRIVPPRHLAELAALLPAARADPWPGVGHQPQYTHPGAFADRVGRFVAAQGR